MLTPTMCDAPERPEKDGNGRIALDRRGNAQSVLSPGEKEALIFATGLRQLLRHVHDKIRNMPESAYGGGIVEFFRYDNIPRSYVISDGNQDPR